MNFERLGMDEESLIRKVSRIRFFDSLSCNRVLLITLSDRRFQSEINNKRGNFCINNKKIDVKLYSSKNISFINGVYWVSHEYGTIVEKP